MVRYLTTAVTAGGRRLVSLTIELIIPNRTDLAGSATFIGCTFLSLYWAPLRAGKPLPSLLSFHPRQLIMSGFCVLWAGRLGSYVIYASRSCYG